MQSSVPVDLISDVRDASKDLVYSFSAKKKSPLRTFGGQDVEEEAVEEGRDEGGENLHDRL